MEKEISYFEKQRSSTHSQDKKISRLETAVQNLKCEKSTALEKLKGAAQSYKILEKAKVESKQLQDAQSSFKMETLKLEHEKELCTLRVEMEQCKINLSSSDSEKKWLEESLKSFQAKAKKYDDISAQGVRSLIQMNAFNEKADVREKERESRRSQARSVLGMVRQSSVNNRTDGYVGNHRHEDDIARKRKRVSDDFMVRS